MMNPFALVSFALSGSLLVRIVTGVAGWVDAAMLFTVIGFHQLGAWLGERRDQQKATSKLLANVLYEVQKDVTTQGERVMSLHHELRDMTQMVLQRTAAPPRDEALAKDIKEVRDQVAALSNSLSLAMGIQGR